MELTEIKIGEPARRALKVIGVSQLEELTKYSAKELLQLHGFGPKALRILKETLCQQELKLKE
ncbi:MAG: DNA-binding domain protein [Anaerocolumna sp.]|jgi:DNA-directed RNA polymerase alpha subunit|nr:DNA-binding domain protein [Anaerocolumna sp.]